MYKRQVVLLYSFIWIMVLKIFCTYCLFIVAKLIWCELRRGELDSVVLFRWDRDDVTLKLFLSLFRIIRQYLCPFLLPVVYS